MFLTRVFRPIHEHDSIFYHRLKGVLGNASYRGGCEVGGAEEGIALLTSKCDRIGRLPVATSSHRSCSSYLVASCDHARDRHTPGSVTAKSSVCVRFRWPPTQLLSAHHAKAKHGTEFFLQAQIASGRARNLLCGTATLNTPAKSLINSTQSVSSGPIRPDSKRCTKKKIWIANRAVGGVALSLPAIR